MVAAVGLGQARLLVRSDRADDGRPERLRPLAGDQPDAAGRRVPQDRLACLDRVGPLEQVLRGHALQHHRRSLLESDAVGQLHQLRGRHHARLRIRAVRRTGVGDAVARGDVGDALANRLDDAGAFHAEAAWQGLRIQAGAEVDVDVVQADRMVAHRRLAGTRCGQRHVLPRHHFRSANGVDADRLRCPGAHLCLPSDRSVCGPIAVSWPDDKRSLPRCRRQSPGSPGV